MEFLSDKQAAAFGRFEGELSRSELERFFFLDGRDRDLLLNRRGDHNRLGFAVQLGTVRCVGTFLSDPLDVPWSAVDYLAVQLDVADPSVVKRYAERLPTQHEHAWEIRQAYGYRDFSDPTAQAQLREFMDGRAWTHAEGALALFTQSAAPGGAAGAEHPGPSGVAGARRGGRADVPHSRGGRSRRRRRPGVAGGGCGSCCGFATVSGCRTWSCCAGRRCGRRVWR